MGSEDTQVLKPPLPLDAGDLSLCHLSKSLITHLINRVINSLLAGDIMGNAWDHSSL